MTRDPIQRLISQRSGFVDRTFLSAMSAQEIVDVSVRGYQALAWTILRRTVLPTMFCVAAWLFVAHYLGVLFDSKETEAWKQAGELSLKLAMSLGVALPIFLIGVSWITALVTVLTSDWILDRVPNGPAASARALRVLPRLTGAMVREAMLSVGGVIFSLVLLFISQLIPDKGDTGAAGAIAVLAIFGIIVGGLVGIFVFVVHSLVPSIVVVEGISASAAGRRSRMLLSSVDRNRQNPGQAALLMLGLVTTIAILATIFAWVALQGIAPMSETLKGWMAGTVFNALARGAWNLVPVFLVLWLVLPIWAIGTVATYYSTRVRVEGYDIDLLSAEVAQQDKRARFEI